MNAAEKISQYLVTHGIKQTYVSEQTGIPQDRLNKTLSGQRKLPADEFILICHLLKLDLRFFSKGGVICAEGKNTPGSAGGSAAGRDAGT
ncbi:MAG: helix-turn-helix transcriptional regulator [Eubacteriales bacterium]|nr:helix-turn-helix transcriptional regulator [Eubacteriales bacterium]